MSKSSPRWLDAHRKDKYVKQAHQSGYRSRAVYKLAQIDERDHLFRPHMKIIDLGAAPGGWSQWVVRKYLNQVQILALDILPMQALPGVTFIQGDFREQAILEQLSSFFGEQKADLVMSDMAPNLSGEKAVDQPRAMLLTHLAKELALNVLAPGGHLLTKAFQGEGFDEYFKEVQSHFKQVLLRKPEASQSQSSEMYVIAKGYLCES